MKKIILLAVAIIAFVSMNAQVELRLNPIGVLFGSPDLSGEYIVSDDFGAELTLSAEMGSAGVVAYDGYSPTKSGFGAMVAGKYYFGPDKGCDKFYAGLYLRDKSYKVDDKGTDYQYGYERTAFSGGLMIGYKWVSRSNVVFEIGTGIGKAFSDKITWTDQDGSEVMDMSINLDGFGRLAVGYRF